MNTEHPMLSFPLNNGYHIPAIGFGTYMAVKDECKKSVELALKHGYRLIDTAAVYQNEEEIGEVLEKVFKEGNIKREELFITTKLWCNRKEDVREAFEESLKKLKLDYVDLYLIHQPISYKKEVPFPTKKEDFVDIPIQKVWGEMEKLVDEGLAKSIGVSNFNIPQLKELLSICRIKPVVNQLEFWVYHQQPNIIPFLRKNHIHMTAYSAIGNNESKFRAKAPSIFDDEVMIGLGKKYNKSPAQIALRFALQTGISIIPKSIKEERIISNCQVVDWSIEESDMKVIQGLHKGLKKSYNQFFFEPLGLTYEEYWRENVTE
ncbi:Aldose reductase [Entamoeba marina]